MVKVQDTRLKNVALYKYGLLIKIAAWLLLSSYQSIASLVLAQTILGIATSVGSPAFSSLVSENLDKKKHISEWAHWELMQGIVTAASSIMSGFIVVRYGFSSLFTLMAIITTFSFIISLSITKQRKRR